MKNLLLNLRDGISSIIMAVTIIIWIIDSSIMLEMLKNINYFLSFFLISVWSIVVYKTINILLKNN